MKGPGACVKLWGCYVGGHQLCGNQDYQVLGLTQPSRGYGPCAFPCPLPASVSPSVKCALRAWHPLTGSSHSFLMTSWGSPLIPAGGTGLLLLLRGGGVRKARGISLAFRESAQLREGGPLTQGPILGALGSRNPHVRGPRAGSALGCARLQEPVAGSCTHEVPLTPQPGKALCQIGLRAGEAQRARQDL